MSGRREQTYEVRSRIEGRSSGRFRLALVVLALLAIGWLFATLTNRPGPIAQASPSSRAPSAAPVAASPGPSPTPDTPPLIEAFPGAPADPFPVEINGLAWVHPAMSAIVNEVPRTNTQWTFVLTDGSSLCVCLAPSQAGLNPVLRIHHYAPAGDLAYSNTLEAWRLPSDTGQWLLDAQLTPGAESVDIVAASQRSDMWEIGLGRFQMGTETSSTATPVGSIPNADLDGLELQSLNLWIAPDGGHAMVSAGMASDIAAPGVRPAWRWLIPIEDGELGTAKPAEVPGGPTESCVPKGWATAKEFVSVCVEFTESRTEVWVRRDSVDGSTNRISIGAVPDPGAIQWLLDGSSGALYGWDPGLRAVTRIAVPSLTVLSRTVGELADPGGVASAAPTTIPVPGGPLLRAKVQWTSAGGFGPRMLTGSQDGTLLYLAVPRSVGTGSPTGRIEVLDAERLRVVAAWAVAPEYLGIGMSPLGSHLFAAVGPDEAERQRYGTSAPSVYAYDPATGKVVLILRDIVDRIGGVPAFPLAQPLPDIRF